MCTQPDIRTFSKSAVATLMSRVHGHHSRSNNTRQTLSASLPLAESPHEPERLQLGHPLCRDGWPRVAGVQLLLESPLLGDPCASIVFTLLMVFQNRKMMDIKDSPERDRFAFIVGDYKPEYYFWECLEMIRKVSLTGEADLHPVC